MTEPLRAVAAGYAATITEAIGREYPNHLRHPMSGPDDRPTPREVHPAFFGCLDWHSAVEMHWALIRLLRLVPDAVDGPALRAALDAHLTPEAIATEVAYFAAHPGFERPYGWGWALTLADELAGWDDPDSRRWSRAVAPLAATLSAGFVRWLPKATYPTRDGAHANSAFALARALPYAHRAAAAGDTALLDAITTRSRAWYGRDADYPAAWEPGGADFLSPALTEAELMSAVLPPEEFAPWFDAFLPRLAAGEPASIRTPAEVTDPSDGQIAHLHGLNLYRAYAWQRLAARLDPADPRVPVMREASTAHAAASLPAVTGEDYMVEHWLAAYAVLLLG
ncbi:MAG TPA: DUF2891 domain-containing protein [Micromonosporaceae bacterium]|nr:DUF2891 domain-containing protein [Micromonosporaceae bacterium]